MLPDNDFQIGKLTAEVSALRDDVRDLGGTIKTMAESVDALKIWKAQVVISCSLISGGVSLIFYAATEFLKK